MSVFTRDYCDTCNTVTLRGKMGRCVHCGSPLCEFKDVGKMSFRKVHEKVSTRLTELSKIPHAKRSPYPVRQKCTTRPLFGRGRQTTGRLS